MGFCLTFVMLGQEASGMKPRFLMLLDGRGGGVDERTRIGIGIWFGVRRCSGGEMGFDFGRLRVAESMVRVGKGIGDWGLELRCSRSWRHCLAKSGWREVWDS